MNEEESKRKINERSKELSWGDRIFRKKFRKPCQSTGFPQS